MIGWIARLIGRMAVEKIKSKVMPDIKKIPLPESQYYQGVYTKKHIILHHTAGGSAASSVAHWASNPDHIATAYIVDRDGTIYETFPPQYWAYHLGVKSNSAIEKSSIGIEICSYGALKNGKTYTGKLIPEEKRVAVDFRGEKSWEAYTPEQIESLAQLIPWLCEKFKITLQTHRKDFWEYQNPSTLPMGVWSHTTVRKDKIDIAPQPAIVEMVYSL